MSSSLTSDEIALLERGLPRLEDWGPQMLVPFEMRRLRIASVIWLNSRWFIQRGLDVSDDSVRHRLETWLCEEFAYAVQRPEDPTQAYTDQTRVAHADRYGLSNGRAVHGGSGRTAVVGCFQAKGIGITPLVGGGGDWVHSHGCASMEEAVREAIFGEIFAAEFPHGSVPIIAILDTALYFSTPSPKLTEEATMRRAILVRPAVSRAAHAERAALFNPAGAFVNSQRDDVQRCRDVIQRWERLSQSGEVHFPTVAELITRVAEQIAFGQVHRLFNGGYFSSNVTMDGALLDFGASYALPSWVKASVLAQAPGFGDELTYIDVLIRSLAFHFSKYAITTNHLPLVPSTLKAQANATYQHVFNRECLRVWGLVEETDSVLTDGVVRAMRQYFAWQQRRRVNFRVDSVSDTDWLYGSLINGQGRGDMTSESITLRDIQALLRGRWTDNPQGNAKRWHAWMTAIRLLQPRVAIDRAPLRARIFRAIPPHDSSTQPDSFLLGSLIDSTIGKGRRHWPHLPSHLTVLGHVSLGGSSALLCRQISSSESVLWLEGYRHEDRLRLFSTWLVPGDLAAHSIRLYGTQWSAVVRTENFSARGAGFTIKIARGDLHLPDLQIVYPGISSNWTSPA